MALTQEAEQRLKKVGLIEFLETSGKTWRNLSQHAYHYAQTNFPPNAVIRPDDVAKVLRPLLEVNDTLRNYLSAHQLKQKYWISDFGDLIIDGSWADISQTKKE